MIPLPQVAITGVVKWNPDSRNSRVGNQMELRLEFPALKWPSWVILGIPGGSFEIREFHFTSGGAKYTSVERKAADTGYRTSLSYTP